MFSKLMVSVVMVVMIGSTTSLLARELHVGKVLAAGNGSITIRDTRDMDDDRFVVTAETKITRNGKPAKLSDLGIGDQAKINATEANGKLTAVSIEAFMPE
ncbi:hypothetical protein ETAA8_07350 [Anatilimnocola aggregata]|uniref:DUF5666 domain-containing protein n=1 Tax=Anatilimnocola aggregata TaxID=2528021 RepID=A0A517Y605_9BACT|nr:hypothetical protein [Anatilimnocola aggregata]QDU25665.1 hypothetical protein ETAA8_07350 [Anatilimnocola aggregata]